MHYLTKAFLTSAIFVSIFSPYCFSKGIKSSLYSSESTKIIFIGGLKSGHLQCLRVDKQTGELTDISQCDKDFSKDMPGTALSNIAFQHNHLYLISALSNVTLEYDIDPSTLVLSNMRRFRHGTGASSALLLGNIGYFPTPNMNRIYQFLVDKKDGALTPMSPPFVNTRSALYGPNFMVQNPFNPSLFYVAGFNSCKIGLFKQSQDGTLSNTNIIYRLNACQTSHLATDQDFLYATNSDTSTICQFRMDHADGHLTPLDPPCVSTHGAYPTRTVISGNKAYTANKLSSNITSFVIKEDGTLVQNNPKPVDVGTTTTKLIINEQAHRLYANSADSPYISSVHINEDGSLDSKVEQFETQMTDPGVFIEAEIQPEQ